jgi:hypothetical protein
MPESTKNEDGAQGKASEAETDREQVERPHAEPEGTAQEKKDPEPRPTDLGEAREQTKQVLFPYIRFDFWKPTELTVIPLITQAGAPKQAASSNA